METRVGEEIDRIVGRMGEEAADEPYYIIIKKNFKCLQIIIFKSSFLNYFWEAFL